MKTGIIPSTELYYHNLWLTGSFHLSDAEIYQRAILRNPHQTLGDMLDRPPFYGGRGRRIYVENPIYGVPYLSNSDMLLVSPLSQCKYISKKFTSNIQNDILKPDWILVSRVGTIGQVAYVRKDLSGAAGSDNIFRIVPSKKVFSGYLYAFLSSKIGKTLIKQLASGGVQDYVDGNNLARILIPRLEPNREREIHELIQQASDCRVEVDRLLQQAQDSLITLLFGTDNEETAQIIYNRDKYRLQSTPYTSICSGDFRLDASYHASTGNRAIRYFVEKGVKLERLDQICLPGGIFIPGRFKRIYVDKPEFGVPFLTGISIMKINPIQGARLLSYRQRDAMNDLILKEKMILITRSGNIGNSVYINKIFLGSVGSDDLIRVIADPEKIPSGYLFAYLRSPIARLLIKQKTYGAVIPHIEDHHLFDLPIPRFDTDHEISINKQIEAASDLQVKASKMEEQAQSILSTSLGFS